jgi:hypothetical protein
MNNDYLYNKVINRYLLSTRSFLQRVQFTSQPVSEQDEENFFRKKLCRGISKVSDPPHVIQIRHETYLIRLSTRVSTLQQDVSRNREEFGLAIVFVSFSVQSSLGSLLKQL